MKTVILCDYADCVLWRLRLYEDCAVLHFCRLVTIHQPTRYASVRFMQDRYVFCRLCVYARHLFIQMMLFCRPWHAFMQTTVCFLCRLLLIHVFRRTIGCVYADESIQHMYMQTMLCMHRRRCMINGMI